jgi:shikimate kinase
VKGTASAVPFMLNVGYDRAGREMIIFVVGPSSAGKTTLVNCGLPEFSTLRVLDLDAEENRHVPLILARGENPGGWEGRWCRNLECLRRTEASGVDTIVDVGAGSLQTADGRRFFVERGRFAIGVVAPWEVILRRHPGRNPEEFRQTEYSPEREEVYRAARFQVDSSIGTDESVRQFRKALQELLNRNESR